MHRIELVGGPMDGRVLESSTAHTSLEFPQLQLATAFDVMPGGVPSNVTGRFHIYSIRQPELFVRQPHLIAPHFRIIRMDFQGTR